MPKRPQTPTDSSYITSIDGRIVRPERATVAIQDWGFRYGWGVFETIRLTKGRPLFLTQHLARIQQTAAALLLDDTDQMTWWRQTIARTIAKADYSAGAINLYWTRGEAPRFAGRRIVVVRPRTGRPVRQSRVWICPWPIEPGAPGVAAKTLCYLPYTFATLAAHAEGFNDALILNSRGSIADTAAASLFIIEGGRLASPVPSDGALPGITRAVVLECATAMGIPVRNGPVSLRRAQRADGAFLTSSLRSLTAVSAFGDRSVRLTPESKRIIDGLRRSYRRAVDADLIAYNASSNSQ